MDNGGYDPTEEEGGATGGQENQEDSDENTTFKRYGYSDPQEMRGKEYFEKIAEEERERERERQPDSFDETPVSSRTTRRDGYQRIPTNEVTEEQKTEKKTSN